MLRVWYSVEANLTRQCQSCLVNERDFDYHTRIIGMQEIGGHQYYRTNGSYDDPEVIPPKLSPAVTNDHTYNGGQNPSDTENTIDDCVIIEPVSQMQMIIKTTYCVLASRWVPLDIVCGRGVISDVNISCVLSFYTLLHFARLTKLVG